jgi:hypothetical protein
VPIATQVPIAEIVGKDDDDVGLRGSIEEVGVLWQPRPDDQQSQDLEQGSHEIASLDIKSNPRPFEITSGTPETKGVQDRR